MRFLKATVLLLLVLALASTARAQLDTATVVGTVVDVQGGVLPGVVVTVRNVDSGFVLTGVSDSEGRYRIAAIPPGRYAFTAALQSFSTAIRKGVTLTLGSESVINFELSLATVAEEVTVTADAPVIQTTTATVQSTMNREQIDLLPLIGRSYISLLRLTPGVVGSRTAAPSFTGSRTRSNQWHIDGVDNSEDISGFDRQEPALDSIKEVQVIVNGFKAEFGQASGGIVNVVTRSGTNALHGSGFFLYRGEELMSRNPYAERVDPQGRPLPKDPFQRIHYGGTIGGPVRHDRLHYFVTYEREDRDTFTASTVTLPPSTANFSPATRQFLAANGIDPALFGAGGKRRLTRPAFVNQHKATVRVDNQVSANQFLTVRYTMDHERDPPGSGGTLLDFNGNTEFFRTNYATVNHKWIAGANGLNEAYFQFGQSFGDWFVAFPNLTNITVTGNFSLGGASNYPQGRTDYTYQFVDHFTWNRSGGWTGEHAVKLGTQIKIFRSDGFFDSNFRGTYTFPTLQAFIDGRPTRFTQNRGNSRLKRPNEIYGFYVQDDWRPRPSLTLNFGLRYDHEGAKTEALRDVTGEPGPGISRDKNNFAPRLGVTWAPGNSTRHAIYAGSGIYYDQVILNIQGNARFTPPKIIGVQIDTPAWPDPFLGGTVRIPPPSLSIIDPDLVTPYNWNSQIGYRRELLPDLGLDVSFVYNRGWDHVAIVNTNAGFTGSANILGVGARRPDPNFTNKSFYTNRGIIRYKALLVDLKKRFSHNFQGGVAYTLSQTRNNAATFTSGVQVPTHPHLDFGPDGSDRRHRVESHVEVNLPWDVQLGAIVEYRSEAPLNITAGGRDLNGDGITGDWVNEAICVNIRCPGATYARNSVRELSTEEANRLRTLLGQRPIERFEDNPGVLQRRRNAPKTLSVWRAGIPRYG